MVREEFSLGILGSSLSTGRLSADWVPTLVRQLETYPEAKGPIEIYNLGKGSQNSAWGVTQIPLLVAYHPRFILFEGFGINDSIDSGGGPAISRAQHIINIQTMIAGFRSGISGVDLTIQTMSPVSAAGAALRPALADYYADEIAIGTTESIGTLDNYVAWPHPLPDGLSYGAAVGYTAFGGTWNPAVKNANITLSGSNLNAKNVSGTIAGCPVLGTLGFSTGKHNFSTTVVNVSGFRAGIMTTDASIVDGNPVGNYPGGYGYAATGFVYAGSANASEVHMTYGVGDVISVCVNMTLLRVWWSVNGFCVNGDPVAGIGGTAISAGTYYPAFSGDGAAGGGECSAIFASTYPGDGLHPLWAGGVNTYFYPAVITLLRAKMAALWP